MGRTVFYREKIEALDSAEAAPVLRLLEALAKVGVNEGPGFCKTISEATGYSRNRVSDMLSAKSPLNPRFMKAVGVAFGINEEYTEEEVMTPAASIDAEALSSFPDRLIKLAIGAKSARAFAMECGISPTGFHQNLKGKTEPARPALIAIARTAGVRIDWLITGEGP